eukprot:2400311-Rhodomonas_salina.2
MQSALNLIVLEDEALTSLSSGQTGLCRLRQDARRKNQTKPPTFNRYGESVTSWPSPLSASAHVGKRLAASTEQRVGA